MCGAIVLGTGAYHLVDRLSPLIPSITLLTPSILMAVAGVLAALFVLNAYEMKVQQEVIENQLRMPLGLWLKKNVRQGESVYLEPLGYIGFFSDARMIDFPGLVAPEVVRLRMEKGLNFDTLIPELSPDWIVLRPGDAPRLAMLSLARPNYSFKDHYAPVPEQFDVRDELKKYTFLPGRGYLNYDAKYLVFRKRRGRSGDMGQARNPAAP
jgi:hypothetical protein